MTAVTHVKEELDTSDEPAAQAKFRKKLMRKVELPRLCAFRMCHDCNQVQPPRTFHCEVCQRCVLKGDHHCFWTGNCVGLRN